MYVYFIQIEASTVEKSLYAALVYNVRGYMDQDRAFLETMASRPRRAAVTPGSATRPLIADLLLSSHLRGY